MSTFVERSNRLLCHLFFEIAIDPTIQSNVVFGGMKFYILQRLKIRVSCNRPENLEIQLLKALERLLWHDFPYDRTNGSKL